MTPNEYNCSGLGSRCLRLDYSSSLPTLSGLSDAHLPPQSSIQIVPSSRQSFFNYGRGMNCSALPTQYLSSTTALDRAYIPGKLFIAEVGLGSEPSLSPKQNHFFYSALIHLFVGRMNVEKLTHADSVPDLHDDRSSMLRPRNAGKSCCSRLLSRSSPCALRIMICALLAGRVDSRPVSRGPPIQRGCRHLPMIMISMAQ